MEQTPKTERETLGQGLTRGLGVVLSFLAAFVVLAIICVLVWPHLVWQDRGPDYVEFFGWIAVFCVGLVFLVTVGNYFSWKKKKAHWDRQDAKGYNSPNRY